jgi:transcriptional regulator with XRE-family HTH domain
MTSGEALRSMRSQSGISMRDVEESSRIIAEKEGCAEYFVSTAWLTQLENTDSTPSIYKIFTLSMVYGVTYAEILRLYGVDVDKPTLRQLSAPPRETRLVDSKIHSELLTVEFPVRFDPGFRVEHTNLMSRMVEIWGQIPVTFLQNMATRNYAYGYIGTEDFTLFPMLKPGSFVQIDTRQTKVAPPPFRTEYERPIYFVELRDAYICSWCELDNDELFIVPHPLSGIKIRRYPSPQEAEIVGRVTGISTQVFESDGEPKPKKRTFRTLPLR